MVRYPGFAYPAHGGDQRVSSVIIVGALVALGVDDSSTGFAGAVSRWLGFGAVVLASVNIFGGFLVTQRMLAMYRKKDK